MIIYPENHHFEVDCLDEIDKWIRRALANLNTCEFEDEREALPLRAALHASQLLAEGLRNRMLLRRKGGAEVRVGTD